MYLQEIIHLKDGEDLEEKTEVLIKNSERTNKGVALVRYIATYKTSIKTVDLPMLWTEIKKLSEDYKNKSIKAIDDEINSIEERHFWQLTDLPHKRNAIGTKFDFST